MIPDLISRFCLELGIPHHDTSMVESWKAGNLHIITAEREGKTVGIGGFLVQGENAQGEIWYVIPEYRRSKVAHELFTKMHELAKEKGCIRAVVLAKRQRAKLYLNHGYQEEYVLMARGL